MFVYLRMYVVLVHWLSRGKRNSQRMNVRAHTIPLPPLCFCFCLSRARMCLEQCAAEEEEEREVISCD